MARDNYVRRMNYLKSRPKLCKLINVSNLVLTVIVYLIFILFTIYLFLSKDERLLRILCTTAISFFIVTVFRKVVKRQRPYTKYQTESIISKEKKNDSFPSRHVFSAFVIAMSCLFVNTWLGVFMMLVSLAIALCRFVGGVHYFSDVAVGAAVGILSGVLGLYII